MSHTIGFPGEQNRGFQIGYNSGNILFGRDYDVRPHPDPKTFWNVPFRRNPDFIDHGNVLSLIKDALALPSARFALTGLGGIGKSQFVIEFAYRCRESLTNNGPPAFCFWVDASSQSQFENSFMDIAVQLGLTQRSLEVTGIQSDILQVMKDWLIDERNGNWVLIVDNADDISVLYGPDTQGGDTEETKRSLAGFLPQSPNGKVLFTSRDKTLADRLVGYRPADVLEVQPMPCTQALNLMQRKLPVDKFDEKSARKLLKALGFLPLAIVHASAYINQKRSFTSIPKYLEDLRGDGPAARHLLEHSAGGVDFENATSRSLLSTMKLSWDLIGKLRPTAVRLLSLMVFFNCQGIQTSILRRHRYQYAYDCKKRHYGRLRHITSGGSPESYFFQKPSSRIDRILRRFFVRHSQTLVPSGSPTHSQRPRNYESLHARCKHPIANDDKPFEEDVQALQDFSLVSISTDGSALQIHSLVRAAIRTWLNALKEDKKWKNLSFQILAEEFPLYTELEPLHICEQLITHVELDAEPPPYGNAFKDWAQISVAIASYAADRGDECLFRKTSKQILHFVEIYGRKTFHKEVCFPVTGTLATALVLQAENCVAAGKLLNSLDDDRKNLPAHHPDLYQDLRARAWVSYMLGGYEEAQRLFQKAVKTWTDVDGENGLRTLISKLDLGSFLLQSRQCEEAKKVLSAVKEQGEMLFGERAALPLIALFYIGRALYHCEKLEASANTFQNTLKLCMEEFGENCTYVVEATSALGIIRQEQGKLDEAELMFRQALERSKVVFGEDSSETENYRKSLEEVQQQQGERYEAAEVNCS